MQKKKSVKRNSPSEQQNNLYALFTVFSLALSFAAIAAAVWFGSIVPIVSVGLGLFFALAFVNGIGY